MGRKEGREPKNGKTALRAGLGNEGRHGSGLYTTEEGAFRFVRLQNDRTRWPHRRTGTQAPRDPRPLSPSHRRDTLSLDLDHSLSMVVLSRHQYASSLSRQAVRIAATTNDVAGEATARISSLAEVECGHATPISSTRPAPHASGRRQQFTAGPPSDSPGWFQSGR